VDAGKGVVCVGVLGMPSCLAWGGPCLSSVASTHGGIILSDGRSGWTGVLLAAVEWEWNEQRACVVFEVRRGAADKKRGGPLAALFLCNAS